MGIFPTQGLNPGLSIAFSFFTLWATREAPGKPQIYWVVQPAGDPVQNQCEVQVQRQSAGKTPSWWERCLYCITVFNWLAESYPNDGG